MAGILSSHAQTISVVASGFAGPIGICKDKNGNLFVAESGSGNNDAKITLIDAGGNKHTIVYGLPSFTDTSTHETSGAWRPSRSVQSRPSSWPKTCAIASASSMDDVRLPSCSTPSHRRPDPPTSGPSSTRWLAQCTSVSRRPS